MRRVMLRLDDDLYTRIFNAAHDQRLSMNAWVTEAVKYALPLRVVVNEEVEK